MVTNKGYGSKIHYSQEMSSQAARPTHQGKKTGVPMLAEQRRKNVAILAEVESSVAGQRQNNCTFRTKSQPGTKPSVLWGSRGGAAPDLDVPNLVGIVQLNGMEIQPPMGGASDNGPKSFLEVIFRKGFVVVYGSEGRGKDARVVPFLGVLQQEIARKVTLAPKTSKGKHEGRRRVTIEISNKDVHEVKYFEREESLTDVESFAYGTNVFSLTPTVNKIKLSQIRLPLQQVQITIIKGIRSGEEVTRFAVEEELMNDAAKAVENDYQNVDSLAIEKVTKDPWYDSDSDVEVQVNVLAARNNRETLGVGVTTGRGTNAPQDYAAFGGNFVRKPGARKDSGVGWDRGK